MFFYPLGEVTGLTILGSAVRRIILVLMLFALLVMSSHVVLSQRAPHSDFQTIQQLQFDTDKRLTVAEQEMKIVQTRLDRLEAQETADRATNIERLTRLETVSNENQVMIRGVVIGVAILVIAEILKVVGISLVGIGKREKKA